MFSFTTGELFCHSYHNGEECSVADGRTYRYHYIYEYTCSYSQDQSY